MKTIDSTLQTEIESGVSQIPIAKVDLFKTVFPEPSWGANVLFYRDQTTGVLGGGQVYVGTTITNQTTFNPLDQNDMYLQPRGALWEFYGDDFRPLGLTPNEDLFVEYEFYFQVPPDATGVGVEFKMIGQSELKLYGNNSSGIAVASLNESLRIKTHTAPGNEDDLVGQISTPSDHPGAVNQLTWTAGSWHVMRLDWLVRAGAYAKFVLLWKMFYEDSWELVDSTVINTQSYRLGVDDRTNPDSTAVTLPGVLSIAGVDEVGKTSTITIDIAKVEPSGAYDYDAARDSYGVLRPNRMLEVYTGFNTQGVGNTPALTDWVGAGGFKYFIDNVKLVRVDGNDTLRITARDTRKKAEQQVNLLFPDVLSFDVAGIKDGIWGEPDGRIRRRLPLYDRWTLANTTRDLLLHSGFSSGQLWAKNEDGTFKITESNIKLGREGILTAGDEESSNIPADAKYSFVPGAKVLDLVNKLAEEHGYDWGMDASGDVFMREANNPVQYAADSSGVGDIMTYVGDWTRVDNIDSFAGIYTEMDSSTGNIIINPTESFEAYNLIFERFSSAGTVTVKTDGAIVSGFENFQLWFDREWFHYDGVFPASGVNPTILEIGKALTKTTHTITVQTAGGADSVRFGGVELFTRDRENPDITFDKTRVLKLTVDNTDANIRNDVIIAGAEKGQDTNEIIHSRSTDILSMTNINAKNYVGEPKILIAPNPSLTRQDVVDWTSLAVLKRHRTLADIVDYQVPGVPHLELGDCINITDADAGFSADNDFWVRKQAWKVSPGNFTQTVSLNPYKPFPSYRPLVEPAAPTGVVTEFLMSKHPAGVLNPPAFYDPNLSTDNPPILVKVEFDLWKTTYINLQVRSLIPGPPPGGVQAHLIPNQTLLEPGHYTFFWNGRWYDQQGTGTNYTYAPKNPSWDGDQWRDYQNKTDPIEGGRLGNAQIGGPTFGYSDIHIGWQEVSDETQKGNDTAKNKDDRDLRYFKTSIGRRTTGFIIADTVNAKEGDGIEHGGRAEVDTQEDTANSGLNGVVFTAIHLWDDAKYEFSGSLDLHMFISVDNTIANGGTYYKYPMKFGVIRQGGNIVANSFLSGANLYEITNTSVTPWLSQASTGITELREAGSSQWLIDFNNLELFADGTSISIGRSGLGRPADIGTNIIKPYREDYLDHYASLHGGGSKVVSIGWDLVLRVRMVNGAGDTIDTTTNSTRSYKLESGNYTSNKHFTLPHEQVINGSTPAGPNFVNRGTVAQHRRIKNGSLSTEDNHPSMRSVHFTSSDGTIDWSYD